MFEEIRHFLLRVVFYQHIMIFVFILRHIVEETKQTAEETKKHEPNLSKHYNTNMKIDDFRSSFHFFTVKVVNLHFPLGMTSPRPRTSKSPIGVLWQITTS